MGGPVSYTHLILTAFGATVNAETFALSREYCFWIALGIPFYMFAVSYTHLDVYKRQVRTSGLCVFRVF